MAPKCHAILVDGTINSSKMVYRNVLLLGLFSSVKAWAHIRCLPSLSNSAFLLDAIRKSARFLHDLIEKRARKQQLCSGTGNVQPCSFTARSDFIWWLALRAYLFTAQRISQVSLKPVKDALRRELYSHRFKEARKEFAGFAESEASKALQALGV